MNFNMNVATAIFRWTTTVLWNKPREP